MDKHEFDTVKAEKANALAKYRRVRNIAKLFQVLEVFVALTLISWSSTRLPSFVRLTGNYLIQFSDYVLNPHVVFLIGNVIVLALYVLSRHFDAAESDSGAANVSENNHKCSTVDLNSPTTDTATCDSELPPLQPVMEETSGDQDKQIVCFENAVAETECEAAAAAIEKATKQIERFQRTQSEKLKREISMKPRKEFRRSATEIGRIVVNSANHHGRRALTSFETVDRLSNEEFRLKVEAFIEKQQSFLKAQKLAEYSQ